MHILQVYLMFLRVSAGLCENWKKVKGKQNLLCHCSHYTNYPYCTPYLCNWSIESVDPHPSRKDNGHTLYLPLLDTYKDNTIIPKVHSNPQS